MATVRISELPTAAAIGTSTVPCSTADGTSTGQVSLQAIANLATSSSGTAVASNTDGIAGASAVSNIVSLTQAQYDALDVASGGPGYDDNTAYIIVG